MRQLEPRRTVRPPNSEFELCKKDSTYLMKHNLVESSSPSIAVNLDFATRFSISVTITFAQQSGVRAVVQRYFAGIASDVAISTFSSSKAAHCDLKTV